jgi:seryl-tRNA synthetase
MNGNDVQRGNAEEQAIKDLKHAEKDLQKAEQEILDAEAELERVRKEEVTINVNGKDFRVHRGDWVVQELKKRVEVDPSQVLAEITPQGLTDLRDDEVIKVHQDERFMSHARSGASS